MIRVQNVIKKICKGFSYFSMAATFFVMMLMVIDIILSLFSIRVLGNYELTEMAMTIIIFLGLAYTQTENGHVRVTMFVDLLPKRFAMFLNSFITLVTAGFCALMTYCAFIQSGTYSYSGTSTAVLHVPYSPFSYVMFIGFLLLTIAIVLNAITFFIDGIKFKANVIN